MIVCRLVRSEETKESKRTNTQFLGHVARVASLPRALRKWLPFVLFTASFRLSFIPMVNSVSVLNREQDNNRLHNSNTGNSKQSRPMHPLYEQRWGNRADH